MRKMAPCLLLAGVWLWVAGWSGLAQSPQAIVASSLRYFFESLQVGDVDGLRLVMGDDFMEGREALLRPESGYPAFLRRHYQGTRLKSFTVELMDHNTAAVDLKILLPPDPGVEAKIRLIFKRADPFWKISEEIIE